MMSKTVMRQEMNRLNCVLPLCYRLNSMKTSIDSKVIQNNHLNKNPFFAKYSKKINNKSMIDPKVDPNICEDIKKSNQTLNPMLQQFKNNRSLNDILRLDLLSDKTTEEICDIWKSYYKNKDCIYGVIPAITYDRMFRMSSQYKTFLLPIPRTDRQSHQNKYEFILSEFKSHKCFFTPLIAYQNHKELAPVCLTLSHFPELQNERQIVLMFGEYDSNVLNGSEAQCLANQLQWYYSTDHNVRQSILLHRFNCEPNHFNHMDLIHELENHIMAAGVDDKDGAEGSDKTQTNH